MKTARDFDDEDRARLHALVDMHQLGIHTVAQALLLNMLGKLGEIHRLIDTGDFTAVDEAMDDYQGALTTISMVTCPFVVEEMAKEQTQESLAIFENAAKDACGDDPYWEKGDAA